MPASSRYDRSLNLKPDILLSYENDRNRVFTLHLRPGHKWSDGSPFTAEDFRYQWEDVLIDKDMERGGLDPALYAGGEPPKFEVIDPLTVRYTWQQPNPLFLPALAGARPLDIYSASAYLKQFHAKYADRRCWRRRSPPSRSRTGRPSRSARGAATVPRIRTCRPCSRGSI